MKILLTGILDAFVADMVPQFQRDGHEVSVLAEWEPAPSLLPKSARYKMSPSDPSVQRILEACRFDAVIFFFSCQCEALSDDASVKGAMLDALLTLQPAAQRSGVAHFILITDRRVFGRAQEGLETEQPLPDSAAGVLIKAAEDCFQHSIANRFQTLLVRVTSLYAPGWSGSFFRCAARMARDDETLTLSGPAETPCDFLRAADLAEFLCRALEEGLTGTAHALYGEPSRYADLAARLSSCLPKLRVSYTDAKLAPPMLKPGLSRCLDWVPRHNWMEELPALTGEERPVKRRGPAASLNGWLRRTFGRALPYLELAVLAVAAFGLTKLTGRDAMFRYLNFWLLYVVMVGNMHGIRPGLAAALIACFFYGWDWIQAGNELRLLLYNIDNWLPMTTYLLGGGIFGYLHDKRGEQLSALEREKQERDEEAAFLETIYQRAAEDRDRLQAQVVRSRDSYGRIYSITRELDSLQPEQIFLSTLNVMEGILQNQSVAIYYYKPECDFARLVLRSGGMKRLANSLDLSKLPLLRREMDGGKVFANTDLSPSYPAFAAPILMDRAPIAMIVLWDVPFDQCSLYFQNLFSITCGLVQSAMVRAIQYFNLTPDVYVENTHILSEGPFLSALEIYRSMRRRHAGDFLLLRVTAPEAGLGVLEFDSRVAGATRSTDLCGRLDSGSYYVLLPQADEEHFTQISARFAARQLRCEMVPQECEALE